MVAGRKGIKVFFGMVILCGSLSVGVSYAKKGLKGVSHRAPAAGQSSIIDLSTMKEVFSRIEAEMIGQKTLSKLHPQTQKKLNEYAELVISKTEFSENQNPLYIDNPDLHRLLCFFITSYVYAAEAQNLPLKTQIYLVSEEETSEKSLSLEIKNVQNLFDSCQKLEVKLYPTGMIYFNWDLDQYLNGIELPVEKQASADVPQEFKNDPLLSKLFKTESEYGRMMAGRDPLEGELVNLLLEGVKNQLASGQPNLVRLVTKFGQSAGSKLASRAWAERRTLAASLVKDNSNLFSTSEVQRETAKALTRLVALPGKASVSDQTFVTSVKKILDSDIKMNIKVGKEMLYVGFKLQFK